MAFKTCSFCGKQVRVVDTNCWNCRGTTFVESTAGSTGEDAGGAPLVPTQGGVTSLSYRLKWSLVVVFSSSAALWLIISGLPEKGTSTTPDGLSRPARAYEILAEQKSKMEATTRRAIELVSANRVDDLKSLYQARWQDLARLRANIVFDDTLTKADKDNIDRTLAAEQEGLTKLLDQIQSLYR